MHYILYHQVKAGIDCPDGISAAWVAAKAYPDAKVVGAVHQEPVPISPTEGDRVTIVDFSYGPDVLDTWADAGVTVEVIDHHKTALDDLSSLSDRILQTFDMKECGATLAWKTLFPEKPMPYFLNHIRDRDLWLWEIDGTAEIHEAMGKLGRSFELLDRLAQMDKDELQAYLMPIGTELLEEKKRLVNTAVKRHQRGMVAGYQNIPYVVLAKDGSEDRLTSDICSAMQRLNPSPLFTACFTSDRTWSLRSNRNGSNFDVGRVAKDNGGGGHRNASGFKERNYSQS